MSQLAVLTDADFQTTIDSSANPVMVDFFASWCQPCKALTPLIEAVAEEYAGKLDVKKVDIDNAQETAMRFGIQGVPTVILFKNGQEVDRFIGLRDIKDIKAMADKAL
jgi:thioredoxin 1